MKDYRTRHALIWLLERFADTVGIIVFLPLFLALMRLIPGVWVCKR